MFLRVFERASVVPMCRTHVGCGCVGAVASPSFAWRLLMVIVEVTFKTTAGTSIPVLSIRAAEVGCLRLRTCCCCAHPLAPFQHVSFPFSPLETSRSNLTMPYPCRTCNAHRNRDMDGRHGGPNSLTMSGGGMRGSGGREREREAHTRTEMPHMDIAGDYRGGGGGGGGGGKPTDW